MIKAWYPQQCSAYKYVVTFIRWFVFLPPVTHSGSLTSECLAGKSVSQIFDPVPTHQAACWCQHLVLIEYSLDWSRIFMFNQNWYYRNIYVYKELLILGVCKLGRTITWHQYLESWHSFKLSADWLWNQFSTASCLMLSIYQTWDIFATIAVANFHSIDTLDKSCHSMAMFWCFADSGSDWYVSCLWQYSRQSTSSVVS